MGSGRTRRAAQPLLISDFAEATFVGRWLICSLISVTVLAVGVTLKLSRSQNFSSVKTADRYWQETGLRAEALDDVVDDDSCRSSQRYFLACANAVAAVADRLGLRLKLLEE